MHTLRQETYSDANVPQRERDIPASISRLDSAIARLDVALGRLEPVLAPATPVNPSEKPMRQKCPLAEELDRYTDRVEALINYVERVEL